MAAEALGGSVEVLECLLGGMALFAAAASPWGQVIVIVIVIVIVVY